ncbi:MAG: hypothetical protein ACK5YR_19000 [Pirellula sp.]|jgi:hypothetical protein
MAKKKKNRYLGPRVKRMNRKQRLIVGRKWLEEYTGKNKVRGYCKHFAVDWRCAVVELTSFGVPISPEYVATREREAAAEAKRKAEKKAARLAMEDKLAWESVHWHPYTEPLQAYLAGDFEALHDLELRERDLDLRERELYSFPRLWNPNVYDDEVPF